MTYDRSIIKNLSIKRDRMKKLRVLLSVAVMSLVMVGCSGGSGGSDSSAPPTEIPPAENDGLDPSGVTKPDDFLDKYYGDNLLKDDYETTEEFNQKREDTFAPIRGNVTFLNPSSYSGMTSFSNTYDADTSTGKIAVKFYNAVFSSSVGNTEFLGYKYTVFYERTTSGLPGGETYHPTRTDSYIIDNIESGSDFGGNDFVCETSHWYNDLHIIECTYEYYAEPNVAKDYIFSDKITINVNNSEIDHRFTYNAGNSRTLNNYVGSFISYTIMNGDNVFAELKIN